MIFSEVANKHHARCLRDGQRGFSEGLVVLNINQSISMEMYMP
jgi:hypothetical protein